MWIAVTNDLNAFNIIHSIVNKKKTVKAYLNIRQSKDTVVAANSY